MGSILLVTRRCSKRYVTQKGNWYLSRTTALHWGSQRLSTMRCSLKLSFTIIMETTLTWELHVANTIVCHASASLIKVTQRSSNHWAVNIDNLYNLFIIPWIKLLDFLAKFCFLSFFSPSEHNFGFKPESNLTICSILLVFGKECKDLLCPRFFNVM